MTFVYLINEVGTNNYKIGKSKNVNNRIDTLQTGNSSALNLVKSFESLNYSLLEKTLHSIFKEKQISREWFKFDKSELLNTIIIMELMCKSINSCVSINEKIPVLNEKDEKIIENKVNTKGKKIHICEKCEKTFKTKSDFVKHINRKNPCDRELPYECEDCGKTYSDPSGLFRHKKNKKCKSNDQNTLDNIMQLMQDLDETQLKALQGQLNKTLKN